MPKINQEEYEVLKNLDDKWKWIARDEERLSSVSSLLNAFKVKPFKNINYWKSGVYGLERVNERRFQSIQWEDEEPYNIAELIEEYESEETEVKKDIEWLKEEIEEDIKSWGGGNPDYFRGASDAYENVKDWLNQLDEPEVLSQEWIDENKFEVNGWNEAVHVEDLQNLLVPKQEEIAKKKKQEAYIKGFEEGENQTVEFYDEEEKHNFNKKVNQLIKAIENPKRIKLRDVIERMDVLSEKNRNDWLERINERYEAEEEKKYYALIKGHENISSDDKYWNYCITDESLDIGDNKVHADVLAEYVLNATKDEWENLGINDDNACFVEVEEMEE